MNVGYKIKKLREEKNVPQTLLACELQVSQSELSKIENGQVKKIDFLLMVKVLKFFEKDISYFIGEDTFTKVDKKVNDQQSKQERMNAFQQNMMKEIQFFMAEERVG